MQAEASLVAGRGETVTWEMRERMPFSRSHILILDQGPKICLQYIVIRSTLPRAVILEIQRFADIAPTGLIHKTVCDVSIEGFELPQVKLLFPHLQHSIIIMDGYAGNPGDGESVSLPQGPKVSLF